MPRTAPRPTLWPSHDKSRIDHADAQLNWALLAATAFCGAVWTGALLLASVLVN